MNGRPIDIVLVDFDDTLVDTGPRFQHARRQLLSLMRDAGFDDDSAYHVLYHVVDPDMRAKYGLGPKRMEPAFIATYERLCELNDIEVDAGIAAHAGALGRSCYGPPPAFDGALDALRRLAASLPTVIYTQSGDLEYQLECVRGVGVIDIVTEDRVHIADRKDAETFLRAIGRYGVSDPVGAWMVGNSMRSDINPALEAGANAILVEASDPWEYDLVDPFSSAFHRVPTFAHAVDLLIG